MTSILGSSEIMVANMGAKDKEKSKKNFWYDLKNLWVSIS